MITAISNILISILADYLVIPVVILGAWAVLWAPREEMMRRLKPAVAAGLAALVLAGIGRVIYPEKRPFITSGAAPKALYWLSTGFPSIHVLLVFTATFVVWAATKNVKLTLVMLVLSVLVALGRVIALVHSPLDVIGAIICAFIAVIVVYGRNLFDLKQNRKG